MQPAHVFLWSRPDATRKASRLARLSLCIQVRGTRVLESLAVMCSGILRGEAVYRRIR
jgi:hypothetical protein